MSGRRKIEIWHVSKDGRRRKLPPRPHSKPKKPTPSKMPYYNSRTGSISPDSSPKKSNRSRSLPSIKKTKSPARLPSKGNEYKMKKRAKSADKRRQVGITNADLQKDLRRRKMMRGKMIQKKK